MHGRQLPGYWSNADGASSAEFALVLFPFIGLVLGILWICVALYGNSTLHNAAEQAARCWSVQSTWTSGATCSDGTSAALYAASVYYGPAVNPVFTATATGCGHTVTATATVPLNTGLLNTSIPLSAAACFP